MPRTRAEADRVVALAQETRARIFNVLMAPMNERHHSAQATFLCRYDQVGADVGNPAASVIDRTLIGAYFSERYVLGRPTGLIRYAQDGRPEIVEMQPCSRCAASP